jgi:hypothetical protein
MQEPRRVCPLLWLAVAIPVALFGLFLAAVAPEFGISFGMLIFAAAVVAGFAALKRHFDRIDTKRGA